MYVIAIKNNYFQLVFEIILIIRGMVFCNGRKRSSLKKKLVLYILVLGTKYI